AGPDRRREAQSSNDSAVRLKPGRARGDLAKPGVAVVLSRDCAPARPRPIDDCLGAAPEWRRTPLPRPFGAASRSPAGAATQAGEGGARFEAARGDRRQAGLEVVSRADRAVAVR